MAPKALPSPEVLRQRLRYEPETGKLFWREFDGMSKKWRTRYSNKEAFTNKPKGYLIGQVDGVPLRAHRVAWAIYYGEWPKHLLDHINGVRTDNRICNLREVTPHENNLNMKKYRTNTSGAAGVYRFKETGKWRAFIYFKGTQRHLGFFDSFASACAARAKAQSELGFSERHGRSSDVGGAS